MLRLTVLTAALLLGCDGSPDASPSPVDISEGDTDSCEVEPTWTSLRAALFQPTCGFGSCHGPPRDGGPSKGDLRFGLDASNLVNVPAHNSAARAAGKVRVVPGSAAESFLWQKVRGLHEADEGDLMPKGRPVPLDDPCTMGALERWINEGASR